MPAIGFGKNNTQNKPASQQKDSDKKEYKVAPEGAVLPVDVVKVEYRLVDKEKASWKKYNDEIVFEFVCTGDGIGSNGDKVEGFTNRHFWYDVPFYLDDSAGCRLRLALQELIGFDKLPDTFIFDTDELDEYVGFDARIRVNVFEIKNGDNAGQKRNGVVEVLRALPREDYEDAEEIFG